MSDLPRRWLPLLPSLLLLGLAVAMLIEAIAALLRRPEPQEPALQPA